MGDYKIESIYEPGYKSFVRGDDSPYLKSSDSPYLGKPGMVKASNIGLTTDPRTANQIAALSLSLNQGIVPVEIGNISPQTFEQIPIQHFHEMRRKAKLAEAKLTLHAPIQGTDPAGFYGEQGWSESHQKMVEKQLKDVMDKAAILGGENMPVTIHGSNAAGSNWKYITDENGKRKKVQEMLVAVDRQTGALRPLREDKKYYPENRSEEGVVEKTYSTQKQLENLNTSTWDDSLTKIEFQRESADKTLGDINPIFKKEYLNYRFGKRDPKSISKVEWGEFRKIFSAEEHLKEAEREAHAAFSKAYELAKEDNDKKTLERLDKLSKIYSKQVGIENGKPTEITFSPEAKAEALFTLTQGLSEIQPKIYQDIESFSINKASDTFSNVALHSFEKHGEKAPAISIENLYQEMGFSQGQDLADLVQKSRDKFIEKAKTKGISESKAKKMAEKLIGVTFDVGHLNMSKKFGYKDEDLVKEAEAIAKYVNKVHLTDNFGFNDSHLPPGMGNVPIQALMEALGDNIKDKIAINEVGGWFEHFKSSPFPQLLEAYGSPIYSAGSGPYWQQKGGFQQSYMEGYGQMLPDMNYQMFGAGFSQLPQDLGGQRGQRGGGRMGGGDF